MEGGSMTTVELTDAEREFLSALLRGSVVQGNYEQLRRHVAEVEALLTKLNSPATPDPEEK